MKKYAAIILIVLMNFQVATKATEVTYQLENDKSVIYISDTVLNLNSFQGKYNLAGSPVDIKFKGNKLVLNLSQFPYSTDIARNYNKIYKRLVDTKEDYHFSVAALNSMFFPYLSEYELAPIGQYTFVLRNSGGFTVEFFHVGKKNSQGLVFRNQNGEIINKEGFTKLLVMNDELKKIIMEKTNKEGK